MKKRKYILIGLCGIIFLIQNSCHYKPFIGYKLNSKGFKSFSTKERIAGNNSNPERDYKINRYDWNLEVIPNKKRIEGQMDIHFTTKSTQKTFLFDLQKKMKIISFKSSEGNPKITRKQDFLYLKFENDIPRNTRIKFTVKYKGKPANVAGQGPIQWEKDKLGRTWISSVTEGIGPQFIMPCNALLIAEADSSSINITVPDNLVAVSNGKLKNIKINKQEKTKTYMHEVSNPINTYSLSFNIGHFKKITKPHTDINGIKRELNFYVLDYNQEIASEFYNQTTTVLTEFEKMYGEFPFWEDGCKFIESTFTAMEHQSAIAFGSNYKNNFKEFNMILAHELAHEWWGNSVTGKDYCDVWIHEGLATYSEALFLEKIYSKKAYETRIQIATQNVSNTIPMLKECDVLYNSWVNDADQDIYNKGALMMHSLRKVVNDDDLFLNSLHTIQKDFSKQNISTNELVLKFNNLLNKDYTNLFDWYLTKDKPPVLDVFMDKKNKKLYYKWKDEIPFYNNGKVFIKTSDTTFSVSPTAEYQHQELTDSTFPSFLIEKSIYYIIEIKNKL